MREPIVINAETREITVPETERAFGVAGERKVEVKHIRIEGRTVDGTDLTQGFSWKVSCENAGKELCADLIDGIVADAGNIEFDWIVGAAPMAYKGTMHFAVCAVRVDAAGNILQEWHSKLGAGVVANGIEATVQNIGGQDLLAHIQSITAAAQQNAAAAQRDAAAAAKNAEDAANSAAEALNSKNAAAKSAENAAENAKAAGDAATKVVEEGVAEKLTEMQNIQKDVSTKAQTAETAAKNADTAKTAAQNAQKAAEKSAGNAANSESAAKTSAEQAAAARDTAQELAGRVTVDDTLSDASASPVQNKVIFAALAKKQDVQRVTFVINDTDGGLDAVVAD
uniref:hypothetical protein n=1 Tax=Gemmiger formicilis TaxID=745368 RepID=UPI004027F7E7